ncbi:MAG: hypothetical protein JWO03_252, partial [Bacteroidetes bacterium]|nr:hypothetical protein [Bacteroidota bacterium]
VFSGTNNGMAILGSYMAVTGTNNTMTLYNNRNPASPVLVRSMPTGPMPRAVTFSGANILVTNFNNRTLEIFGPTCSVSTAVTLQSTNGSLTMQSMSVGNSSIGNNLSTTINGTTGSSVPIINTNSLSVSGNYLTSVVNGISSNALNIGATVNANIYNHDGTLDSTRTLIQNDKPLTFATTSNTNGLFLQNLNGGIGTPANLFFSTYPDQAPGVKYPGASISGVDDGLYSAHLTFGTKLTGTDANPIAERMRLTSAGNLGIGNTAPAYALHVGNSTDTTDRYITVDASAAKATALQFNSAGIQSWKMYRPGSSSDLRLYGGGADRITFQNSGNVGIGNISPSYALHIGTATDATDRYIAIDAAAAQSTALQLNSAGSQSWKIYRPGGSGDLRLFAGGADRATFQSTGNVGIGNTAPAYTLHVGTGTDATDRYITIDAASAQATALQLNSGGTQSWKIYRPGASTDLRLFGNGADRVTFKNNGNVGIGTTSPGQALTVNGSGGIWNSNQVNFYTDAGTTQKGFLGMQSGSDMMLASSTASNWMRIGANNGSIAFFPDNTITSGANPKVVIASSGNVGIGTVTPGSLLYVGNGTTTSNTYVTIDASAGQQSAIQFSSGGAQSWVMYRPGGSSDLRFYGNGADRMTMQAGGNVGIGTSNPTQAMLVVNGIASGGNQNLGNYHYYASGGNGNSNGAIDISVYATNRMVASEFDATSDRRIKKDLMHSESSCDLATLAGLQVTDFKYVDAVSNGKDYKKGFIAQEVERVFPEAVQKHIDFIPSIYSLSTDAKYIASTKELHIMMAKPHGLKQGDVVRIMSEADEDNIYTVAAVINEREFAVKDWTKDMVNSVFVYGKRVDDFRTVDYDRIYTLNVSATQELYRIIREQQQTIAGQQSENKTMKSDIDHLKASVETLQQIIGSKAEK